MDRCARVYHLLMNASGLFQTALSPLIHFTVRSPKKEELDRFNLTLYTDRLAFLETPLRIEGQ